MSATEQAEDILRILRDNPEVDVPPEVDTEDIAEEIDPDVAMPVNLNQILESLVEE